MKKFATIRNTKFIESEDDILYPKMAPDMNLDILGLFVNSTNFTNAKDRALLTYLTQSAEVCGRVRFLKTPTTNVSNCIEYNIKKAVLADRDCSFYIHLLYEFEYAEKYDWYETLKTGERSNIGYVNHILNNYEEICIYLGNKFDIDEVIKQITVIRNDMEKAKAEEKKE